MIYTAFAIGMTVIVLIALGLALYKNEKESTGSKLKRFWNFISNLLDKYWWVCFIIIFAVFLFSRFYKLGFVPFGIHVDELSIACDGKSLRDFGTDRYGIRHPFYLVNNGGGQNALYTYAMSIMLRFMPDTIFTLRSFAVFCGALCLFAMFGICYELSESKKWALIGPILVTILPVFVMSERWALESYLLLPFSTYFMYFAIRAVKYEKQRDWIITGVLMGLSLYTYAVTFIMLPVMLVLIGVYLIIIKKFKWKQVLSLGIPLFIFAIPLIIFNLVNLGFIPEFSTSFCDFKRLPYAREQELGLQNVVDNLVYFKDLFFGGEELTYNVFPEFGTIYAFLLVFMIIGLVYFVIDFARSFKEKRISVPGLFICLNVGGLIFTMLLYAPNINRTNELFLPIAVYIFWGIYKSLHDRPLALTVTGVCGAASFAFFMYFYLFMSTDVYGLQVLFSNTGSMMGVDFAEEYYLQDGGKIYVMIEDEAHYKGEMMYYVGAEPGQHYVNESTGDDAWKDAQYGNVIIGFPAEFDENENAVYVIGDNWNHITSYMISVGFNADRRYPGYTILYKELRPGK